MEERDTSRVRITLRWIKILDRLEPFFDEEGEFRFRARIFTEGSGDFAAETRFPEEGYYAISDRPGWNFMELNKVIFEGEVGEQLVVELFGEELDALSSDDQLVPYRREFHGRPDRWYGVYKPHDEADDDPEKMSNWRVCYVIERA